jgi:hypothetical protein
MFSKQDKMKVPVGTCAMYPLVLNQWEGLISPEWILSLLWRRGLAPPGEDKVDPTTLHHLRSHFHILSHQLIASSFVVSHFLGFENCLLVVYSNFDDASCFCLALRRTHHVPCCQIWFPICGGGNEFDDGPLLLKPFPLVFFLRYKKKNFSCLLSSVCLKTARA